MRPELMIVLELAAGKRASKGSKAAKYCRKYMIGFVRRRLAAANVVDMNQPADDPNMRREAETILAAHCRACGGCELSKM